MGGISRPLKPSSPLIVWNTSHIWMCKTKKPECGEIWQVKNRLIFSPLSLFLSLFLRQCLEVSWIWSAGDADTPGVVWTKTSRDTRAPRYTVTSIRAAALCCSTPTHQLPQCTIFSKKKQTHTKVITWHLQLYLYAKRYTVHEKGILCLHWEFFSRQAEWLNYVLIIKRELWQKNTEFILFLLRT